VFSARISVIRENSSKIGIAGEVRINMVLHE
jgi:hypothetical protein